MFAMVLEGALLELVLSKGRSVLHMNSASICLVVFSVDLAAITALGGSAPLSS